MISSRPPDVLLGRISGTGCEVAELGTEITETVETVDQIDARSDARFQRARTRARQLEREYPTVAAITRMIVADIEEGLELDSIEDAHRRRIALAGSAVEQRGRFVVVSLKAYALAARRVGLGGPDDSGSAA